MESIQISEVLNKLNQGYDVNTTEVREFSIGFLTKDNGARELRIRKYTRGTRQSVQSENSRAKASHSLQKHGTVMLQDIEGDRIVEVKAAMIYAFRDFKSNNWLKVYH